MVEFDELHTETARGFLRYHKCLKSALETGSYLKEIKKLGFSFTPSALFSQSPIGQGAGGVSAMSGRYLRVPVSWERRGGRRWGSSMEMTLSSACYHPKDLEPVCRVLVYNVQIIAGCHI